MSVNTIPMLGIDDISPACARSSPFRACSVGIRNAAPLMNTLANIVDDNAIASINQRRVVLMLLTSTDPWWHIDLKMLNTVLI